MSNDKRKGDLMATDKMRAQLNEAQCQALTELELLGWSLKFVRMPMFQDPIPVVVSKKSGQIGLLDPDGKIVVNNGEVVRSEHSAADEDNAATATPAAPGQQSAPATKRAYTEKRTGDSPVPEDLETYLNTEQITALRQIQPFGWELTFIRRPMFLEPVAVITNTDGLRVGTLEADGRIDLQQNLRMREEADTATKEEKAGPVETKKLVS
jgi:hypothetical protein